MAAKDAVPAVLGDVARPYLFDTLFGLTRVYYYNRRVEYYEEPVGRRFTLDRRLELRSASLAPGSRRRHLEHLPAVAAGDHRRPRLALPPRLRGPGSPATPATRTSTRPPGASSTSGSSRCSAATVPGRDGGVHQVLLDEVAGPGGRERQARARHPVAGVVRRRRHAGVRAVLRGEHPGRFREFTFRGSGRSRTFAVGARWFEYRSSTRPRMHAS